MNDSATAEPILQFFKYDHLPSHLAMVSKPFCDLAHAIVLGDNAPEAGTATTGHGPLPRNPNGKYDRANLASEFRSLFSESTA